MSDAEILELYVTYSDAFTANMTVFITLIFAYSVATFISARDLSTFQFYATTGLFAIFSLSVAMGAYDLSKRTVSIQSEIVRRIGADSSDISFVATEGMPEFLPPYILGICAISIAFAIAFAVGRRRKDT